MIRVEMRANRSYGRWLQSAVIKSSVVIGATFAVPLASSPVRSCRATSNDTIAAD